MTTLTKEFKMSLYILGTEAGYEVHLTDGFVDNMLSGIFLTSDSAWAFLKSYAKKNNIGV